MFSYKMRDLAILDFLIYVFMCWFTYLVELDFFCIVFLQYCFKALMSSANFCFSSKQNRKVPCGQGNEDIEAGSLCVTMHWEAKCSQETLDCTISHFLIFNNVARFSVTVSLVLLACMAATQFTKSFTVDSDYKVCLNSFMAVVKSTLDFSGSGNGYIVIYSLHHVIIIGLFVLTFVRFPKKKQKQKTTNKEKKSCVCL